jgi:caa(3)-type oxidase subunit IV
MAEGHHSHKKLYYLIFGALTILTIAELYVPEMSVAYNIKAALLTFLAVVKAFLVAYIFMHLNEETRWLKFIAAIPISAGIYAAVVMLESYFR